MPEGVGNAYAFSVFNTISFSIALTTPMMLFFKSLGASATVLGIVMALPPLLTVLQMPAAQFVERVGYRSFVLRGWTTRSVFIFGMAMVALLPERIPAATRMALMLFLLFVFNVSRGISLCGWLPWITQLIPEAVRGRFISRDQMSSALAMLGTMLGVALFLKSASGRLAYGAIFFASFVAAGISLLFLRRIPDVPAPAREGAAESPPWMAMLLYRPFLALLVFDVIILVAFAGGGVFWIPFLRDYHAKTDSYLLGMAAVASATSAGALLVFGRVVDRVGSRPVLALSAITVALHFFLWSALAAGLLPVNLLTIFAAQFTAGLGGALFNLANTRLVMSTVPVTGRSHFFALFSVITSLTLGLMPIVWGVAADSLEGWRAEWFAWQWNQYSLLYLALVAAVLTGLFLLRRVAEPKAMKTEEFFHELFVETPARAMSRLLARRPFP
jgi:MFS family permease